MLNVTNSIKAKAGIHPMLGLILHGNDNETLGVTQHNIENGILQTGKYVSPETVIELLRQDKTRDLVYQKQTIIAENDKFVLWFKPAIQKPMWFRVGKFSGSFDVKWPTLLFVADKRNAKLFVYALGASTYPNEDAVVYNAPLMNIGWDGLVCQGSASLPREISSATIDSMEATIYDSNFTHVNNTNTLRNTPSSKDSVGTKEHLAFWRSRDKSKANMPKKHLVRYSTLSSVMSKLR